MYYNADGTMKIIDVICIVRQGKKGGKLKNGKGDNVYTGWISAEKWRVKNDTYRTEHNI